MTPPLNDEAVARGRLLGVHDGRVLTTGRGSDTRRPDEVRITIPIFKR